LLGDQIAHRSVGWDRPWRPPLGAKRRPHQSFSDEPLQRSRLIDGHDPSHRSTMLGHCDGVALADFRKMLAQSIAQCPNADVHRYLPCGYITAVNCSHKVDVTLRAATAQRHDWSHPRLDGVGRYAAGRRVVVPSKVQVRRRWVRPAGIEPATKCLEGTCSIR
jgi:hypothetical protein